jgi:thiol:disulfide interchange protein DsbA
MKKLLALMLFIGLPFISQAADYQEDKHYVKVKGVIAESAEVREYFSFYCGHCFRFEALADAIKKNLPKEAVFVKNHVDFLPGASRKMQKVMTKALATAQVLDVEESSVEAIFKYIHVHHAVFTRVKDVRNVFILNGVDGKDFDQAFASQEVKAKAEVMLAHQDELSTSGGITSVPTVVVNGKYRIVTDNLDKANFEQDYHNLIKYLLTLD